MKPELKALFDLLAAACNKDYIGEPVSQLTHALQAAQAARLAGADTDTILAALFHDIGYLIEEQDLNHAGLGAAYLKGLGFSEKTCALVAGHVDAKRYLAARDERYRRKLSAVSQHTLAHQGGAMSEEEATTFEEGPYFKDILRMRAWDEMAKQEDWAVPDLALYRQMVSRHLEEPAAVC